MPDALLPSAAALVVMTLIGGYVLLDSFDLGAGMLLTRGTDRATRDIILRATAASRYSSEWWLAAAAVEMYLAFPFPFRMLAEGLAIPIVAFILSLVVRGFAAHYRKTPNDRAEGQWSRVFAASSTTAILAQGFCLGGFLRGFSVAGGKYVGGWLEWATPFSALIAIALVTGYALVGSAWLAIQAEAPLADVARRRTVWLSFAAAIAMAAISLATLFVHPTVSARWGLSFDGIDWAYFLPLAPLPIMAMLGLACACVCAARGRSTFAFWGGILALTSGYAGLAVSVWPYVMPYGFSAAQSAADIKELRQVLLWTAGLAPILLVFSALSYDAWRVHLGRQRLVPLNLGLKF